MARCWTFPVRSWNVYDGDTIHTVVDLGFGISLKITGRLYGINTPELRGDERPAGLLSRDFLVKKLQEATEILVETRPDTVRQTGKYGRWLLILYADGVNLNEALVLQGLAVVY